MFGTRSKSKVRRNRTLDAVMEPHQDRDGALPGGVSSSSSSVFSSRMWMAVGILYVTIGCIELVMAALWRHWMGVIIGVGVAKFGTSLIGIGYTGRPTTSLPPSASILARLKFYGSKVVCVLSHLCFDSNACSFFTF